MSLYRIIFSLLAVTTFFLVVSCSQKDEQANTTDQQPANTAFHLFDNEVPPPDAWAAEGRMYNREAPIPSQCYTLTDDVSNPCYTCHQSYDYKSRPNSQNDGYLQGLYQFSSRGEKNHWINLFRDRTDFIGSVSDEAILDYIAEDNYQNLINQHSQGDGEREIPFIENFAQGAAAFDERGLALDGSRWVAFNYKPLPSTFWPTNGSTDDVMIRLPDQFAELNGEFSRDLYFANLNLLEMTVKDLPWIDVPETNEIEIDADIDGDGVYSVSATRMLPRSNYMGDASAVPTVKMLYPEGTAFLHSVRYVGVDELGNIYNAPRLKELRYMVKGTMLSTPAIEAAYYLEIKEKQDERLPKVSDYGDRGVSNKHGWLLWGYIEDAEGDLRRQTSEEQLFCMGCHKSIGTTLDHTFAFARKPDGEDGWGYIDLRKLKDAPNVGETEGEFLTYLKRVGGGDEFRANQQMLDRWFLPDGSVDEVAVTSVDSIYDLITPSPDRALALNKAYKAIVEEQSYIYGRDTVIGAIENVAREVDITIPPLDSQHRYNWDIRLDWEQYLNEESDWDYYGSSSP